MQEIFAPFFKIIFNQFRSLWLSLKCKLRVFLYLLRISRSAAYKSKIKTKKVPKVEGGMFFYEIGGGEFKTKYTPLDEGYKRADAEN